MNNLHKGTIILLIAAVLTGLQSVLVKLCYGYGWTVSQTMMLRFLLAAAALAVAALCTKKRLFLPKHRLLPGLLVSSLFMLGTTFYFLSVHQLNPATAILFFYAYPIVAALLSYFLDKVKITPNQLVSMILALSGLVIFSFASLGELTFWGVALALIGACCHGGYVYAVPHFFAKEGDEKITFNITSFTAMALVYAIIWLGSGDYHFPTVPVSWFYIFIFGAISTALSGFFLVKGVSMVGPTLASILYIIEIPTTALTAFIAFGEVWDFGQMVGAGFILLAILLSNLTFPTKKALVTSRQIPYNKQQNKD